MIQLPCALLLGAPLLLAPDAKAENEDDGANILRVYDVSNLSMSWFEGEDKFTAMLPSIGPFDGDDLDSTEPELSSVDTFVDMILGIYETEFEYEGRRVALGSNGRFVVRGPESLHERIAGMINFLEGVVNAETILAIDTVVLAGSGPDGAVIDQSEAEAWLASLDASVDHQHQLVRVRTDRVAKLDLGRYERAVVDYDVEIAQGSAIQDPILGLVYSGTQLELIGAPGIGGTSLAFLLSRCDRLATEPIDLQMSFWAGSEQTGLQLHRSSSRRADLRVMTRAQAMSTFLPRGKALVLSQTMDVRGGKLREVVLIRQVGGGLPTRHEMALSDGGARLVFADLGAIAPPRVSFSGTLFTDGTALAGPFGQMFNYGPPILVCQLGLEDMDLGMELLDLNNSYSSVDYVGRLMVSRPLVRSRIEDEPHVKLEQEEILAVFDSLLPDEGVYDVQLTVRGAGDETLQARMPLRSGTTAATVLGVQSIEVHDVDVEVAQFCAVADTQMRTMLDGLCLWVRVAPAMNGDLMLEVRGGVQLAEPRTVFDLGSQVSDFLHLTSTENLLLNQRAVLPEVDGAWTTSFGDTTGGGLSLSVRVTRAN